jgi:preprotein translocase subunit SecE
MANQPVQTVGSPNDRIKVGLAICAAIAGVVGFYLLADRTVPMVSTPVARTLVLLAGLIVAVALMWTSTQGRDLLGFSREAIRETKKVVWPTRKEAMQITAVVFGFVLLMALFLWGTDKALEVVLYDLILGWKN